MRPRTRCSTCAKRHVKCDGRKPKCQECETNRLVCSWTRKIGKGVVFQSENPFADGSVHRPRGPRKHLPAIEPRALEVTFQNGSFVPDNDIDLILHPTAGPTNPTLLEYAFNKYMARHVNNHTDPRVMDVECFFRLSDCKLVTTRSCPMWWAALSAAALIYFGVTEKSDRAVVESHAFYAKALFGMNTAINAVNVDSLDDMILTSLLLSSYEDKTGGIAIYPSLVRNGFKNMYGPNGYRHIYGAAAFLMLRGKQPMASKQAQLLDNIVRRRAITACINQYRTVPRAVRQSVSLSYEPASTCVLHDCMIELADLQVDEMQNSGRHKGPFLPEVAARILSQSQALESKMRDLSKTLPEFSTHAVQAKHTASELRVLAADHPVRYQYLTLQDAFEWSLYRASLLRINAVIIRALRTGISNGIWEEHASEPIIQSALLNIDVISKEILASVLYHFEASVGEGYETRKEDELRATAKASNLSKLTFPLHAVASSHATPLHHKRLARDILMLIARIAGSTVLLNIYGRNGRFWIPEELKPT